jgi:division protein CdvB (Snf7/Vps24/ESCRT-III family)
MVFNMSADIYDLTENYVSKESKKLDEAEARLNAIEARLKELKAQFEKVV